MCTLLYSAIGSSRDTHSYCDNRFCLGKVHQGRHQLRRVLESLDITDGDTVYTQLARSVLYHLRCQFHFFAPLLN